MIWKICGTLQCRLIVPDLIGTNKTVMNMAVHLQCKVLYCSKNL